MRVGILAPPWVPVPPPLYGGTELIVDRLARGLLRAGHDVLLWTTGDSTCPVPRRSLLPASEGNRIGAAVPEVRHVMAAYESMAGPDRVDLVHDHTIVGPVYAERFPDLPVVTTNHGPFNEELTDIYRRIASRVPIIAISHNQRRPVPDLPVARVIHHGLDAGDFPFGKGEGGYALFLGRMTPEKGAHRAIEAATKAGVPLLMAAKMREPHEVEYFEKQVEPRLTEQIQYLGEVPHEEKLRLLADAIALLNPIRWAEPFGLVMLEALACGTPVLAFPEGAAPEIVEDGVTGFLCHDEKDMAESLLDVDRLDRRACRAAVEGYFSTGRMTSEHVALYEEIAATWPLAAHGSPV